MLRESESSSQMLLINAAHLKQAQYIGQLDMPKISHLASCGTRRSFAPDMPILQPDEVLDSLFVIIQGEVTVSVDYGTNRTIWLYVAGPGNLVDMSVLLDPPAASIAVHALSSVEALEIPRACLLKEIGEQPSVGYAMMQQLSERLSLVSRVLAKRQTDNTPMFSIN